MPGSARNQVLGNRLEGSNSLPAASLRLDREPLQRRIFAFPGLGLAPDCRQSTRGSTGVGVNGGQNDLLASVLLFFCSLFRFGRCMQHVGAVGLRRRSCEEQSGVPFGATLAEDGL